MLLVKANEATAARRTVSFFIVGTDGITPATGEATGQPQVSTDQGATWSNTGIGLLAGGTNGRYAAALTQSLVGAAGTLVQTRYKSGSTAECPGDSVQVVAIDPYTAILAANGGVTVEPLFARTCSAGSNSSATVSLPVGVADWYKYCRFVVVGGTGAGLSGWITTHTSGGVLSFADTLPTSLDATSVLWVYADQRTGNVSHHKGTAWNSDTAGTPNTNTKTMAAGVLTTTAYGTGASPAFALAANGLTSAWATDVDTQATSAATNALTAASGVTTLVGKLTGITVLANWLKALLRKSAPDATAATEIGGTYDPTTDSLEALRDRGDAAWATSDLSGLATGTALTTVGTAVSGLATTVGVAGAGLTGVPYMGPSAGTIQSGLATSAALASVATNAAAAATVGPLISGGKFTSAALSNAPTGGGGGGSLTTAQAAQLALVAARVSKAGDPADASPAGAAGGLALVGSPASVATTVASSPFVARVPRTLVRPGPNGTYKGANLIYYPAQGVRSCTTGSPYNGLNVAIAWVEWDTLRPLTAVGGMYWQARRAAATGCNVVRAMQDGGGGSWLGLYASGQGYAANRAVAISRMVALARYCASLGLYFYPALNGCSYNGYLTATNGGGGFGAIADHAAAFAAALAGEPNVIGLDACQESSLQYGGVYGMELRNSNGNPLNIGTPSSCITQAQSWALVRQILAACRAAAPDLALTASFNHGAGSSALWSDPEVGALAPYVDFLDCHVYYDAAAAEVLALWGQPGTAGKPLLVGEHGQAYAYGQPAMVTRQNAVLGNVVRAVTPGQPGCYGSMWWALSTQGGSAADDFGLYGLDNSEPPVETGARTVAASVAATKATLTAYLDTDFDADAVGSLAGFTDPGAAGYAVLAGVVAPADHEFGLAVATAGSLAVLSPAVAVPADVAFQVEQPLNGVDGNYAAFGLLFRATADGANGYLLTFNPTAASGQVFIYKKTGGTFAALASAVSLPSPFVAGDVVAAKVEAFGQYLGVKLWRAGTQEPTAYLFTAADATYATGTVGLRAGVTGTPPSTRLAVSRVYVGDHGSVFPLADPAAPADPGLLLAVRPDGSVAGGGTGTGDTLVDHDTGGADALRVVDSDGDGIAGVAVRAYVAGESEAEAETTTLQDGRWASPLSLSAGVAYTIRFTKAGETNGQATVTP